MTSQPVLESKNQYNVLRDNEEILTMTGAIDPRTAQPTKCLASSSSRVNALNEKVTTTSPPIIMVSHQKGFTEASQESSVQPDGAEEAPSANSDQVAFPKQEVPPWVPASLGVLRE